MNERRRRFIFAFLLFLVIACAVLYLLLPRLPWSGSEQHPAIAAFEDSRDAYSALEMRSLTSPDDLQVIVERMDFDNAALATESQREALIGLLLETLRSYYFEPSPDRYIALRQASGASMRDLKAWEERNAPASTLLAYLREHDALPETTPPVNTMEQLLRVTWKPIRSMANGANTPSAVCVSPAGLTTRFARVSDANSSLPRLDGQLENEAWYGGIAASASRVFTPALRLAGVARSNQESILVARTGIVFEFGDGVRRPVIFLSFIDPRSGQWMIDDVTITNFPIEGTVRPWFF